MSASPEVAARYFEAFGNLDVREYLPLVKALTLVMHVRGERSPIDSSREIAANIPGARFVVLPGVNGTIVQ